MGAEDIEENIVVTADGSAAVADLNAVAAAQDGITAASGRMKDAFAQRFEHAGLYLFSRQLFGLAGLSDVARHVMGVVTMGLNEIGVAAGTSAAAMAPWLLGIGAAILVAEKLSKGHKDVADSYEQLIAKQGAALKTTDDLKTSLERYRKVVADMPAEMGKLVGSTAALDAEQRRNEAHTKGEVLSTLEQKLMADKADIAATKEKLVVQQGLMASNAQGPVVYGNAKMLVKQYTDALKTLGDQEISDTQRRDQTKADIKALGLGFENAKDLADRVGESLAKDAQEAKLAGAAFEEFQTKTAYKIAEIGEEGKHDPKKQWAKKRTEMDAYFAEEDHRLQQSAMSFQQYDQAVLAMGKQKSEAMGKIDEAEKQAARDRLTNLDHAYSGTFQHASGLVGTAFSEMIVRGKTWHDAFANFFKDVEAQFIQMVVNMAIKWAAFQVLTGGLFGASPAFASSFVGVAPGTFHATGADYMVDRPTHFVAGEAGMERVQVTPAGQSGGGGGGGGGNHNYHVAVTVNAPGVVTDIRAFAGAVGQELRKQIGGQGQLGLVRT